MDGGLVGRTERGGGGDGRDGDRLIRWEDNVAQANLGMYTNYPLTYALGLEHHHPIMTTLGYPVGRKERER